jgi:hypothetical protein
MSESRYVARLDAANAARQAAEEEAKHRRDQYVLEARRHFDTKQALGRRSEEVKRLLLKVRVLRSDVEDLVGVLRLALTKHDETCQCQGAMLVPSP